MHVLKNSSNFVIKAVFYVRGVHGMPGQSQVVVVAGPSGSGKTTLVEKMAEALGPEKCLVISLDRYYKGLEGRPVSERHTINFDHPDALDLLLFLQHIRLLRLGQDVDLPRYSFDASSRLKETDKVGPKSVILIEGILALHLDEILRLADITFFVNTDRDICFQRRLERDMAERGRKEDDIRQQYETQVSPMQQAYVDPSMRNAHLLVTMDEYSKDGRLTLNLDPVFEALERARIGNPIKLGLKLHLNTKASDALLGCDGQSHDVVSTKAFV